MQTLALTAHAARRWEPKRLRLRLLSIAGRLAVTGRRRLLHLAATAPFTSLALEALGDERLRLVSARAARELIRMSAPKLARASLAVHPDDDMMAFSVAAAGDVPLGQMAYYRAGLQIHDVVRQIADWRFGGLDRVGSFLDFASGYGRSTRFLVQDLSPRRVCVAEIQADALEFQARHFGVSTLLSAADPAALTTPQRHDVVVVASLFTHLPRVTFTPWLATIGGLVAPDGMLIFSVHDEAVNTTGAELVDGFSFTASTEVAALPAEQYGTNYTTEAFVRSAIAEALGDEAAQRAIRLPRALCFLQDLWVVCLGESPQHPLRYDTGPIGHVDVAELQGDSLHLRGWCFDEGMAEVDRTPHPIADVGVYRGGKRLGGVPAHHERPDVAGHYRRPGEPLLVRSGWDITVATPRLRPWDIVTVVGRCAGGASFVLDSARADDMIARTSPAAPRPALPSLLRRAATARDLWRQGGLPAICGYGALKARRARPRSCVRPAHEATDRPECLNVRS